MTTLATFSAPRLPESLAVDASGNVYATLLGSGEIARIAPNGAMTTLTVFNATLVGVAVEANGNVVVVARSTAAANTDVGGIWRVRPDGSKQIIGTIPVGQINDLIAAPGGGWFVSNTTGFIYKVREDGTVTRWAEHALLAADQAACAPERHPANIGANGLTIDSTGALLVANTTKATVVRVPINADGTAGTPAVWAGPDCANLLGADGLTADGAGGVFVAVNFRNTVVHLTQGAAPRVVASRTDGLDTPASVKVGTGPRAGNVIIANAAFSRRPRRSARVSWPSRSTVRRPRRPRRRNCRVRATYLPWRCCCLPPPLP